MRLLAGLVAASALLASFVSAGSARTSAGGVSIATAPVVPFGKQEFGNLAPIRRDASNYQKEFWKVNLVAGDRVKIDFEGVSDTAFDTLFVTPVGTTDYTLNTTRALFTAQMSANNKGELAFTAPQTGAYPLAFEKCACCSAAAAGGGYDFNVVAHHALRLFLGARSSVSSTGSLLVSARLADGTAVTDPALKISLVGVWQRKGHVLGTAAPTNGTARVAFRIPRSLRGQIIRIQAKGEGGAYLTTRSRAITIRVR